MTVTARVPTLTAGHEVKQGSTNPVEVAAKQAEETGSLGRLGKPIDRRSPFFIGMAGAAGVAITIALLELAIRARPVLVLPGYPTAHEAELRARAAALGIADDVRFPAWLSSAELEGLWAIARAFVFPSLYEGFGLPVLEAMARNVPVACSNASSLPEVAGDAAVLFDPHDEAAIASAIARLLGDETLRARLQARGLARVRRFTWERTAQLTLESYARAMQRRQLS